jgi:hypothetical protein
MRLTSRLTAAVAIGLVVGSASRSEATLVFYTDRASFDTANPGLAVEGFENANSAGNPTFAGPLDSTTNNGIFATGSILPGISFGETGGNIADGLYLAEPLQNGVGVNPTNALGINLPPSSGFDILLNPGVTAFALDLFQNSSGGEQTGVPQDYTVDIFGTSGLLGSTTTTVQSGQAGFFGVSSTELGAITEITVTSVSGFYEVIDNVAFGTAAVPEPSSLALCGLGVVAAAGYARGRTKARG